MTPEPTSWPHGQRPCADLVRRTDWAATPLGAADTWSLSLRSTVDMLLACSFPMIALWGPDLVQIYNDGYAGIMGEKHPAGMGQPTRECWPEVWSFNEAVYDQVWMGKTLTFENQTFRIMRHGYLEDAWFTLCYSPLRDSDGAVKGVLITVFETTERVRAEAASRESEQMFRALVTATSYATYTMSPDWEAMYRLKGQGFLNDRSSADTEWMRSYILPEDQGAVLQAIGEAIRTKTMFQMEHRVRQANGETGWTLSRAVPLLNDAGDITRWVGAASDITQRKRSESDLRASLAEKQALLSEVHHRVKNNLQIISSMLNLQSRGTCNTDVLTVFDETRNRIRAIASIHEMLYRSSNFADVDMFAYAQELVPGLVAHYGAQAHVEVHITGGDARMRLERAVPFGLLLNELVSNAIKHGLPAPAKGLLHLSLREEHDAILLEIRDSGPGLPSDFQPEKTAAFGLRLVQILARQLNGSVRFLSQSGTTVSVRIPAPQRTNIAGLG